MERKIISHRIGSILDDISRLSNALYAMDTTDIQRYPDNYEVLSTDAALRAEKIACRLRHLIYSSTTIRKGDYLTSAGIVHGIEVVYEDGVLEVTLPGLLPKRKQRQNTEFLLDPFYFSLEQYAKEHPMPHFSDCVVCFTQVYDQCLPTRRIRDYDNLEEKQQCDQRKIRVQLSKFKKTYMDVIVKAVEAESPEKIVKSYIWDAMNEEEKEQGDNKLRDLDGNEIKNDNVPQKGVQ